MRFASVFQGLGRTINGVAAVSQNIVAGFAGTLTISGAKGKAFSILGAISSTFVTIAGYYAFTSKEDIWEIMGRKLDACSDFEEDMTINSSLISRRTDLGHQLGNSHSTQEMGDITSKFAGRYSFFNKRNTLLLLIGGCESVICGLDAWNSANSNFQMSSTLLAEVAKQESYQWLNPQIQFGLSLTIGILTGITEASEDVSLSITIWKYVREWLDKNVLDEFPASPSIG